MGCNSVKIRKHCSSENGRKPDHKERVELTTGELAVIRNNWRKLKPVLPIIGKNTYLG